METIILDTGPMLALINDQDPKHQITKKYVENLKYEGNVFVTTPPNVTELQHVLHRELKITNHVLREKVVTRGQELIQKFFRGYLIEIETTGDEQSTFDEWASHQSSDHKGSRFDYADIYVLRTAIYLGAPMLTLDSGFYNLLSKNKGLKILIP